MALGQGEPVAWVPAMSHKALFALDPYFDALEDPSVLIYAHNAMMEAAICQALLEKTWNIRCPDLDRFRCTMSLARRAALPASLEKVGVALNLVSQKDTRGKALIRKFCMMQPAKKPTKKNPDGFPVRRILPADDPAAFNELVEYCRQEMCIRDSLLTKGVRESVWCLPHPFHPNAFPNFLGTVFHILVYHRPQRKCDQTIVLVCYHNNHKVFCTQP